MGAEAPRWFAAIAACVVAACGPAPQQADAGAEAGAETALAPPQADRVAVEKVTPPDAPVDQRDPDGGISVASIDAPPDLNAKAADTNRPHPPYRALAIATGSTHTCALLDDHRVKCWGFNPSGALGYGDARESRGTSRADMGDALPIVDLGKGRTARTIAAGRHVTCALLDDGSVKCWGWAAMTGLPDHRNHGDGPNQMGDALPPLDLGAGRTARHLSSGYVWSCAVLDDGSARCWGAQNAQTGMSGGSPPLPVALGPALPVRQLAAADLGAMALFEDGTVTGFLPLAASPFVLLGPGEKAAYVSGSEGQWCAILVGGGLRCAAKHGTAGLPPATTPDVLQVSVGENAFSCALLDGGTVRCWGRLAGCHAAPSPAASYWCDGTLGPDGGMTVNLGQPAIALSSGARTHVCAILADGSVKCWGGTDVDCGGPNTSKVGCTVPALIDPNLGGSLDLDPRRPDHPFGEWRTVDLGTY